VGAGDCRTHGDGERARFGCTNHRNRQCGGERPGDVQGPRRRAIPIRPRRLLGIGRISWTVGGSRRRRRNRATQGPIAIRWQTLRRDGDERRQRSRAPAARLSHDRPGHGCRAINPLATQFTDRRRPRCTNASRPVSAPTYSSRSA
jgi:hypothetical protein